MSSSPAEVRAEREGLSVLALPTFDLVNAAQGHPMIVSALDGTEMLLRLATPDELMAAQVRAIASLPEFCRPEPMTRQRAAELVRPIGGAR